MEAGTAEATGDLGNELRGHLDLQNFQGLQDWPQASSSAGCGEGPHGAHAEGWELGVKQSKGCWGVEEEVCCGRD